MARPAVKVHEFINQALMRKSAAQYILDVIGKTTSVKNGFCAAALAGGRSPEPVYKYMARLSLDLSLQWDRLMIFWSDERYTGIENEDSNYRMASRALLSRIKIPPDHVFRMPVGVSNPDKAAFIYEKTLRDEFLKMENHMSDGMPVFDITMLGVGADGHTASLFPGSPALDEKKKWVMHTLGAPGLKTKDRITLTLPVLNSSRRVVFIVSGNEKEHVLARILDKKTRDPSIPASLVSGREETVWFIDRS